MRKLLIITALALLLPAAGLCWTVTDAMRAVVAAKNGGASGEAGCTPDNYTDFSSASDPPTGWTELRGTSWVIASGVLSADTTGGDYAIQNNTDTSTINQYVKWKATEIGVSDDCIGAMVRSEGASNSKLAICVQYDGAIGLLGLDANEIWQDDDFSSAGVASEGDVIGATVTGTGTSITVRVWINPTGNCPDSTTDWGGDTSPSATLTTSGFSNYNDIGKGVGVYYWQGAGDRSPDLAIDDFYWGSLD